MTRLFPVVIFAVSACGTAPDLAPEEAAGTPYVIHGAVDRMEWYEVSDATVSAIRTARSEGGRVVAVGTTVVRTLESVARRHHGELMGERDD